MTSHPVAQAIAVHLISLHVHLTAAATKCPAGVTNCTGYDIGKAGWAPIGAVALIVVVIAAHISISRRRRQARRAARSS
jgi:hypothetical protein